MKASPLQSTQLITLNKDGTWGLVSDDQRLLRLVNAPDNSAHENGALDPSQHHQQGLTLPQRPRTHTRRTTQTCGISGHPLPGRCRGRQTPCPARQAARLASLSSSTATMLRARSCATF